MTLEVNDAFAIWSDWRDVNAIAVPHLKRGKGFLILRYGTDTDRFTMKIRVNTFNGNMLK